MLNNSVIMTQKRWHWHH